MKLSALLLILLLLPLACKAPATTPSAEAASTSRGVAARPKNVILLIGDGMGLTQITAGMIRNNNRLEIEQFPVVGLQKTYSADDLITDSASGATAFSTGKKTYNAAIGVDVDTMPLITILEEAEARGMATGLVATSTIVHATPASFIAHNKSRNNYEEIAADFLKTEVDLFIGGGKRYFDRRSSDERNLIEELKQRNYVVMDYLGRDVADVKPDTRRNFAYFTADSDPLPAAQGRDYLPAASSLAVNFLRERGGENGFFLMIEGSQIDWGGHANNSEYIITEMLDFDQAIGRVLEFARRNGETLVVLTADHETGGYSIVPGTRQDSIVGKFTTDYHTGDMVPVFAFGPGAEAFSGIYENTAIYDKIKAALGL